MTHAVNSPRTPLPDDERFRRALRGTAGPRRSKTQRELPADGHETLRFRFSSLLLTMAVIGACLAIGRVLPAAGVLVSLIAAPAYIRTALASRLASTHDSALMHCLWQLLVFGESLLVVTLLAVVGLGTLSGTIAAFLAGGAWMAGNGSVPARGILVVALFSGLALGATVTFAVVGALCHRLWPVRLGLAQPAKPFRECPVEL